MMVSDRGLGVSWSVLTRINCFIAQESLTSAVLPIYFAIQDHCFGNYNVFIKVQNQSPVCQLVFANFQPHGMHPISGG
jgi:hypothetical protein